MLKTIRPLQTRNKTSGFLKARSWRYSACSRLMMLGSLIVLSVLSVPAAQADAAVQSALFPPVSTFLLPSSLVGSKVEPYISDPTIAKTIVKPQMFYIFTASDPLSTNYIAYIFHSSSDAVKDFASPGEFAHQGGEIANPHVPPLPQRFVIENEQQSFAVATTILLYENIEITVSQETDLATLAQHKQQMRRNVLAFAAAVVERIDTFAHTHSHQTGPSPLPRPLTAYEKKRNQAFKATTSYYFDLISSCETDFTSLRNEVVNDSYAGASGLADDAYSVAVECGQADNDLSQPYGTADPSTAPPTWMFYFLEDLSTQHQTNDYLTFLRPLVSLPADLCITAKSLSDDAKSAYNAGNTFSPSGYLRQLQSNISENATVHSKAAALAKTWHVDS